MARCVWLGMPGEKRGGTRENPFPRKLLKKKGNRGGFIKVKQNPPVEEKGISKGYREKGKRGRKKSNDNQGFNTGEGGEGKEKIHFSRTGEGYRRK